MNIDDFKDLEDLDKLLQEYEQYYYSVQLFLNSLDEKECVLDDENGSEITHWLGFLLSYYVAR